MCSQISHQNFVDGYQKLMVKVNLNVFDSWLISETQTKL